MSLTLAPGRLARCHQCRTPLEQQPDASRDHGYPVWYCPECAGEVDE
jgi:hypothetical protein